MRFETLEDRCVLALSDVAILDAEKTSLLAGLDGVVLWTDALESVDDLGILLPVVGQPLGSAMDLGGSLNTALVDPIKAYFALDATPTTGELTAALAALDGDVYTGLTIAVNPLSVSGGKDAIPGDDELVFGLTLIATRTVTTHPSLGLKGEALGLAFDATFDATAVMTLDFSFGVDLSAGLDPDEAFFLRIDDWDVSIAAAPALSSSSMRAGFLDATVSSGSMSIAAAADIDVANPDGDPQGDLTLAELDPEALDGMISTITSGTASGSVSFVGSAFAGFTPSGTATASFSTSDPFTPPDLTFNSAFESLRPFTNLTATSLLGVFSQLGISLDTLGDSAPFDESLHIAGGKSFGELLKLGRLFTDPASGLIELLSPGPDVTPIFNSAQGLTTALSSVLGLPAAAIAPSYNPTTHEMTYHVALARTFAAELLNVGFDIGLGSLAGIQSSSKVSASVHGDMSFTLGVDLEDLEARLVPSAASPADGKLTSDAVFSLSIAAANPIAVSVTAASTADNSSLAHLAADFNAALISAGISTNVAAVVIGDRLVLKTMGDLPIESLKLTAAAGNAILTQLHFANNQLALDSVAHHVFLEDVTAEGLATLSAADIDATARFGFLAVGIASGTASGSFSAEFGLKDVATGTVGGRVFLPEILHAVGGDVSTILDGPNLDGSLSATLPISASLLGSPVGGSPNVTISWPDVFGPAPTVSFHHFDELFAFEDLRETDVLAAFEQFATFLAELQGESLYSVEIPGIGISMGEAFDFAEQFTVALEDFAANPNGTLDALEAKIETALGLDDSELELAWIDSEDVLRIDLNFTTDFSAQFPINIDLVSQGLGRLVDISGSGKLAATAQATLQLDLGIDLSTPASPRPFFYETTGLEVKGRIVGEDIEFTTALGPLGIFIAQGTAVIDGDGEIESSADRAVLALGLTDGDAGTSDGAIYFDEFGIEDVRLDLTGRVTIKLPTFFPTSTNFAGNLLLTVSDLGDIAHTTTITGPDFNAAIDNFNFGSLEFIVEAIDAVLAGLQEVFSGQIFGQKLPFVGDDLKDAATFIGDIRTNIIDRLRASFQENATDDSDVVQKAIFDAFGPDGLNLLRDKNNSGTITVNDIVLTKRDLDNDGDDDQEEWDMLLGTDVALVDLPIGFDIGLPGLGLEVDGTVRVHVGFDWKFGFGTGRDEGLYLKTDQDDEITVYVRADIPDLKARGQLLFLQLDVSDEDADNNPLNDGLDVDGDGKKPSNLSLNLVVDLKDPIDNPAIETDNDKLTLNDFLEEGFDFGGTIDARLEGLAEVNLDLVASFKGDARFPTIGAELAIRWPFTTAGGDDLPPGSPDMDGDAPTVAFENITLNVGETIGEFLAPIVKTIRQVTEPFDPIIDFLQMPVPVLSSFGQEVRVLDMLQTIADAYGYGDLAEFINAVISIIDVINNIPDTPNTVIIPLGSFDLLGTDPRDKNALVNFNPNITQAVDTKQEVEEADAEAAGFLEQLNEIGIYLPIIQQPANIFKLMMGQTVDLVQYDMPKMQFGLPIGPFKIGPIAGYPIWVVLLGWVGAEIDLAFGFDTRGFEIFQETHDAWDIFSGLYIWDLENLDGTGGDGPEASFLGRIDVSAEVGVHVIGAGAGGGVGIELGADLVDPDGDGKVHLDEFLDNIQRGVTCTFDLVGSIFVELFVYVEVLYARFEFRTPPLTLVDFRLTDDDCYPDRFTGNDSRGDAVYVGVAPGVHIEGLSLESIGDEDWYEFTLLHDDSITVAARHSEERADVNVRVYNAGGTLISTGREDTDGSLATLEHVEAGNYFVRISGTGRLNNYKLHIEPAASSDTRVIYVSPSGSHNKDDSFYTYESGDDDHDGLSPRKPKASLQNVFDTYDLGPHDLVVFDTGEFDDDALLTSADSLATFAGSVSGSNLARLTMDDADGNWFYLIGFADDAVNVTMTNSDANTFQLTSFDSSSGNVILTASHDNEFIDCEFSGGGIGVYLTNETSAPPASLESDSPIYGPLFAPNPFAPASGNSVLDSSFSGHAIGVRIDTTAHNTVNSNEFVDEGEIGIYMAGGVISTVTANDVAGRQLGIYSESKVADLYGNLVHGNVVGMSSRHGVLGPDKPAPYGAPGGKPSDKVYENETGVLIPQDSAGVILRFTEIYSNGIGIEAYGDRSRIIANDIHNNAIGAQGTEIIGPENWEVQLDNRIHHNNVGVRTLGGAEVRFNRIDHNAVGVEVSGGSFVHHNLIVRNDGDGVLVSGPAFAGLPEDGFVQDYLVGAEIINNTIYAASGNGMRLDGFIKDVRLRNNIVRADGGSALVVHAAAQFGYSSDYNNLYATGSAAVATFAGQSPLYFDEGTKSKAFADLFDWQVEGNSDLHSLGRTSLAPTVDDPLFADLAADNYHLLAGSTSIDAGDPSFGPGGEPTPHGNRINLGAYGGTPQETASPSAWLRLTAPEFYVDLVRANTYPIAWDTFNLPAGTMLSIDVVRESDGTTLHVKDVAADSLGTTWKPSVPSPGVPASQTARWRMRISTTSGPSLSDMSREPFSVVSFDAAAANSFFIDDGSNSLDQYTPTAVGSNRNTGLLVSQPKASLRALLLSYDVGAGDTISVDTGDYVHVVNAVIRRSPIALDPAVHTASGAKILGPTSAGAVARMDRMNPYAGAIALDIHDAPDMELGHLEIRGGEYGVRAQGGSSRFSVHDAKLLRNTRDGLAIFGSSDGGWIDRDNFFENGRHGLFVDSQLVRVIDSAAYDNGATGMALRSVGAARVETSEAYCTAGAVLCQRTGIDIINPGLLRAVVGHDDLTLFRGNLAHHNEFEGIFASGNVLVAGNSAWENGHYGIRLDDGADALRNVAHDHVTGISGLGSTSDIEENRSYINTQNGIEAGFDSNVLRNVTYSNDAKGIYAQRFSGLIEHNLVYVDGLNPVHIEGPGKGAQFINNTVYERCAVNDTPHGGLTTIDVPWDWQTFWQPTHPPSTFSSILWGHGVFEFDPPIGANGETFDLGPGGSFDARTPMAVPPGTVWQISFRLMSLDLNSMPESPLGPINAHLLAPAFGTITVQNVDGALVGQTQLQVIPEFSIGGELVLQSTPITIGREFGPTAGFDAFEVLQTVIDVVKLAPPFPSELRVPGSLPSEPPWGSWFLQRGYVSPMEPPQDRGDKCPEVGVLVSNSSRDVYFRNNIIYVEGDATPGLPFEVLSVDVEVTPDSTLGWDSDFNALMTEHGITGIFGGAPAVDIPAWQAATLDDDFAINPTPGEVWVDADGLDGVIAGVNGFDDNFHLVSPFGYATTGALAPILDNIPGGTNLPTFAPVVFASSGAGGEVSPAVDWGDPDFSFFAEPLEHGKFIDLGAYGDTAQASTTEPEYVHLVFPLGTETLAVGRTYEIRWRSQNHLAGDTVQIELRHGDADGPVQMIINPFAPNTGSFAWLVPPAVPLDDDYVVVVRRASTVPGGADIVGASRRQFEVGAIGYGPTILRSSPEAIECETSTTQFPSITVVASDNLSPGAALDPTNYQLLGAGPGGIFGDGNDVAYALTPTYVAGGLLVDTSSVRLDLAGLALPEGRYRFTTFDTLRSSTLLPLDGDANGLAGGNYVRTFTVDLTPPTVAIPPILPAVRNTPLANASISFSEAVAGFGLADLRLTRDGGPNLLAGPNSLITSADDVHWVLSNLERLTAEEGVYTLSLAATDSQIRDLAGNNLSMNAAVSWLTDTTQPRAGIVPVSPDPRAGGVASLTVVFNEPVYDFNLSSLEITRDTIPLTLGASQIPTTVDHLTWTIPNLTSLTSPQGVYLLHVLESGPAHDLAGNSLAEDSLEIWESIVDPPVAEIVAVTPNVRNTSVAEILVRFNRPVTGVTLSDLSLTRNGSANLLTAGQSLTTLDNQHYHLTGLSGLTAAAGNYAVRLVAANSGILDLADHPLLQDAQTSWTVDLTLPTALDIVDLTPDPRNSAATSFTLQFNEPVFGLGIDDLTLVRTTSGGTSGNLLGHDGATLSSTNGVTWTLLLSSIAAAATAAENGRLDLTLVASGSGIVDAAGNALSTGASESWTFDGAPPTVDVLEVAPSVRLTPVSTITINFNEPVSGLDRSDLRLRRNDEVVALTAAQTLSSTNGGVTWSLANLAALTTQPGAYELSLHAFGSGIMDAAGNRLSAGDYVAWLHTVPGDLNGDGLVGVADLAILQAHLGMPSGATTNDGDMNGDGTVNRTDARLFAQQYGRSALLSSPPPPPPADSPARAADAVLASYRTDRPTVVAARRRKTPAPVAQAIDAALESHRPSSAGADGMLRAKRVKPSA